ncbi:hypothetical protein ACFY2W_10590 [Streptomyces sp. NPDC001262]|uniref:hypothetical protein n=1 Tax=Streptomyces sp. NPDC001262 TaxID=3364552 RepID=UPI0036875E03
MATTGTPVPGTEHVPLEQLLDEVRAAQPGLELAEQRHQFLDLDRHLVRQDYSRPAPVDNVAVYEGGGVS